MQIIENQPLTKLNTFGLAATADLFCEINSERELKNVLLLNDQPKFILGGGSNLLLTQNIGGLVLKNSILGRKIMIQTKSRAYVRVGGGENWHEFVRWSLDQNLSGLENLSLIPGTVGAAPIQNIGAYGVELKDCFKKLEAIDIKTGKKYFFHKKDCGFGYRDSIFKSVKKGRYFITAVWFSLRIEPKLNLEYGAITTTLAEKNIQNPTPRDVSDAVISIRQSKLPDPAKIGNSGSFFKNPEVSLELFEKIQILFPQIPNFPASDGRIKIPAGWLIEQCGWKGKRLGKAGCYEKQALVLVNLGGATGAEIWQLAQEIMASVFEKFEIRLETEVNII
jgi:UDP-N-acetylmuramate dehydrogenase